MEEQTISNFKTQVEGPVILPGDAGYDESRNIWNGMFDKKPAVIARCLNANDVVEAVKFGRTNHLVIAVKGGGHNSAGTASVDDGLVIDLSLMQQVDVDPATNLVKVQGGCLLGAVDEATQKHGLVVSAGIISHTGVGGLTLGGGFGWISRKFGLTIDNLVSVEMVTADGNILTASNSQNTDLFWAIRGGGGNFGIITTFEFKAAKIGTELLAGPIVKRFDDLKAYMQFYREYVRNLPDEMTIWTVIRHAPPLPFLPEEVHGKLVIIIPFVWLGDQEQGEKLIQPIKDFSENLGDGSGMVPFSAWQAAFDGLLSHGARNYWKSHHITDLSDDFIDAIQKYAIGLPGEETEIFIPHMEGAPARVDPESTAFPHRSTPFMLSIHTRWQQASDDERFLKWAKDFHNATRPFSQGVYVNFLSEEGAERVKEAYTTGVWNKLVEVKNRWDPDNLFRMNQNIPPSS